MKKILGVVLVAVMLMPLVGLAATIKHGDSYSLSKSEVINDDLYAAGGTVDVTGIVQGDAVVAGGNVMVNGTVQQGVLAAGGMVSVLGPVGNDVRVAGGNITVGSVVVGDVVAAGGQVHLSSTADVGRDAILSGGNITLDGHVKGRVEVNGGNVVINGPIDGNVVVRSGQLTLGQHAMINGSLTYKSPKQATINSGAVVRGATTYQKAYETTPAERARLTLRSALFSLIVLFVSSWVIFLLLRPWSQSVVNRSRRNFWWHVLWGFIGLIVIPIAAVILMITVIGLPLGLLLLFGYIVLMVLSCLLAPIMMGSFLYAWWNSRKNAIHSTETHLVVDWKTILLGVVVFTILSIIPVIGGLINFIFILAALGTFIRGGNEKYQKRLG